VKRDELGVAGFFEDLPVLLFILAGALTIVISSLSASQVVVLSGEEKELDHLANRCVELLLSEVFGDGQGVAVTVGSVCSTRLYQVAEDFLDSRCFSMGIVMLHPELRWLSQDDCKSRGGSERASAASRLFNALTDDGKTAILVVRIIVW